MVSRPAIGPKSLMLFVVIVATILRKPELLQHPRFFAEEGQSFLNLPATIGCSNISPRRCTAIIRFTT